ncbi:ATP/GTP-binding protein, partial [Streptomyces sp. NPDC053726]
MSSIRWVMGDGTAVTCTGPGTRYDASRGRALSTAAGPRRLVSRTECYQGAATATWTVTWKASALG